MTETIIVSSVSDLISAYNTLSKGDGGTIGVSGDLGAVELSGGGNANVTITAADPTNMSVFESLEITNASNITVQGMMFESGSDWQVRVNSSTNIEIRENVFLSDATGLLTESNKSEVGAGAHITRIADSDGVVFENNVATGHFHGVGIYDSTNVQVTGNDISQFQGDGIRMAGVQRVEITDNYLHDYYGTQQSVNHSDMIQVFSSKYVELMTKDLTISGNVLDSGDSAAQGIFIKNETVSSTGKYYENIQIDNNVIHSAMGNGIRVYHTDGLAIVDNTVLSNSDGSSLTSSGNEFSHVPKILTDGVRNGTVEGNIGHNITLNGQLVSGNATIKTSEISEHFPSITKGADEGINAFELSPSSPLVGYGAAISQPGGTTDFLVIPISAPPSDPEPIPASEDVEEPTKEVIAPTTVEEPTTEEVIAPTTGDEATTEVVEQASQETFDDDSGSDRKSIFEVLFGWIFDLFGGGGNDDRTVVQAANQSSPDSAWAAGPQLGDVVPVIGEYSETIPFSEENDDDVLENVSLAV